MNQSYPVPPPELVEKWYQSIPNDSISWKQELAAQAAQWGADQELEACCKWLTGYGWSGVAKLRADRRPKPPSLKEQALAVLDDCTNCLDGAHENTIRRALEQLPDAL